jgi:ELWxxDGT repeat protein
MLSMSMVKDLNVDTDSSNLGGLLDAGGTLYFSANDGVNGAELWRSDGTAAGTFLVSDIVPGKQSSNPQPLAALGGNRILLTVNSTSLWVSDGTAAGTMKVGDVVPDTSSASRRPPPARNCGPAMARRAAHTW